MIARLGGLGVGEVLAAAVAKRALGLGAALALAAQHGELVVASPPSRPSAARRAAAAACRRAPSRPPSSRRRGRSLTVSMIAHRRHKDTRASPARARAAAPPTRRRSRRARSRRSWRSREGARPPRRPGRAAARRRSAARGGARRALGELEQQRAQQVGGDGRRRSEARRGAGRARRRSIATPLARAFSRAAATDSGSWSTRGDRREAELRGGDREHARAGAEVEQRPARLAGARELDEQLEAQPRRRVRARAERLRPARSRCRSRPAARPARARAART